MSIQSLPLIERSYEVKLLMRKFCMANPSSPLPCPPSDLCQQSLWWDLNLGSASRGLSCHRAGKPQGPLAGCIAGFPDIFTSTPALGFVCRGALKPPRLSLVQLPEAVSAHCRRGHLRCEHRGWMGHHLGLWDQAVLDDVLVWSYWLFSFSQLFGVGLTLESMRGSRAWTLESTEQGNPAPPPAGVTFGKVLTLRGWGSRPWALEPVEQGNPAPPPAGVTLGKMLTSRASGFTLVSWEQEQGLWSGAAEMPRVSAWDASDFSVWGKHSLDDSSYYRDYFYGSDSSVVSP